MKSRAWSASTTVEGKLKKLQDTVAEAVKDINKELNAIKILRTSGDPWDGDEVFSLEVYRGGFCQFTSKGTMEEVIRALWGYAHSTNQIKDSITVEVSMIK